MTPTTDTQPTVQAPPDAGAAEPATAADRYADTLADVDKGLLDVRITLAHAQGAEPRWRLTALVKLHNQIRDIAYLLNQALGAWPEPKQRQPR